MRRWPPSNTSFCSFAGCLSTVPREERSESSYWPYPRGTVVCLGRCWQHAVAWNKPSLNTAFHHGLSDDILPKILCHIENVSLASLIDLATSFDNLLWKRRSRINLVRNQTTPFTSNQNFTIQIQLHHSEGAFVLAVQTDSESGGILTRSLLVFLTAAPGAVILWTAMKWQDYYQFWPLQGL